jgi:Flp pilus assembly protein TadB
MIVMVLIGAAVAAGIAYLVSWAWPEPSDPLSRLARFDAQRAAATATVGPQPRPMDLQRRVGDALARELARHGIRYDRLRQDLELTGQSYEQVLGRKVLVGTGGLFFGLVCMVLVTRIGLGFPPGTGAVVALVMAAVFFFVPDYEVRARASKRRRQFHTVLAVYLRWVSLQMAGRVSAEAALPDAASVGGGWPLAVIRHTLSTARRSGRDTWAELGQLGERVGVPQLRDLAVLIAQVSHDGARVRETLAARADSMQAEALAEVETQAAKRSQTMLGAEMLIAAGFAVFLGYPAIQSFLAR